MSPNKDRYNVNPTSRVVLPRRSIKALQLRVDGAKYSDIGKVLGCSAPNARHLVTHVMGLILQAREYEARVTSGGPDRKAGSALVKR